MRWKGSFRGGPAKEKKIYPSNYCVVPARDVVWRYNQGQEPIKAWKYDL